MVLLRRYIPKLLRMMLGFALIALGVVIAKQAFCLTPWNVLNDGLAHTFPITIGQANIVVGVVILLIGILLRETIGIGMILNICFVGVFTDFFMVLNNTWGVLPRIESVPLQLVLGVLSVVSNALGIYFYMSARMGTGPRDTIMVHMTKTLPFPVGVCRLALEAVVCLIGWLIGGEVGLGSLIFVFCNGPMIQLVFRVFRFDVKAVKNESVLDTLHILADPTHAP